MSMGQWIGASCHHMHIEILCMFFPEPHNGLQWWHSPIKLWPSGLLMHDSPGFQKIKDPSMPNYGVPIAIGAMQSKSSCSNHPSFQIWQAEF